MRAKSQTGELRDRFEKLYSEFNRRSFVSPDPLQFLYDYPDARDRELAGMIAASLAFGNVRQIISSVGRVLSVMGSSPHSYVSQSSSAEFKSAFRGFRYRFVQGKDIAGLLEGIKSVLSEFGSLESCFATGYTRGDGILDGIEFSVRRILPAPHKSYLLTLPSRGSACKRMNLYLRWMVRKDDVDPGGWSRISPSELMIPLDTHMWRLSRELGFTRRKQANLKSVQEITEAFRKICPQDPVKYDFALTRAGIMRTFSRTRAKV